PAIATARTTTIRLPIAASMTRRPRRSRGSEALNPNPPRRSGRRVVAIEGGADIGGDLDRLGAPGLHGDVGHGACADRAAGDGGVVSQVEGLRTEADRGDSDSDVVVAAGGARPAEGGLDHHHAYV